MWKTKQKMWYDPIWIYQRKSNTTSENTELLWRCSKFQGDLCKLLHFLFVDVMLTGCFNFIYRRLFAGKSWQQTCRWPIVASQLIRFMKLSYNLDSMKTKLIYMNTILVWVISDYNQTGSAKLHKKKIYIYICEHGNHSGYR